MCSSRSSGSVPRHPRRSLHRTRVPRYTPGGFRLSSRRDERCGGSPRYLSCATATLSAPGASSVSGRSDKRLVSRGRAIRRSADLRVVDPVGGADVVFLRTGHGRCRARRGAPGARSKRCSLCSIASTEVDSRPGHRRLYAKGAAGFVERLHDSERYRLHTELLQRVARSRRSPTWRGQHISRCR